MKKTSSISPWRVLLPIGLATSLSLLGDASLYTVLPTHTVNAGVSLASVGILLSANRWIRLFLNGPAGLAYERWPHKRLFVSALFIGVISTALYAFTEGFWPLLLGRLLWGLAWSGIWIGGNTIIMDMTHAGNRGRWVGIYQTYFFLGISSGSLLGGFLTDWLGYHQMMTVATFMSLTGALFALFLLPASDSTSKLPEAPDLATPERERSQALSTPAPTNRPNHSFVSSFVAAVALLGVNRLVIAGILASTFALYLVERLGDSVQLVGLTVGITSLTGIMLGLNSLLAMISAPLFGTLSDRIGNRWRAAAAGLLPGVAGFGLLAFASPLVALLGIPLTAIASGSNQGLSTTLTGDLGQAKRHGRRLGILFTTGDLASAIGPPLAFALIPWLGIQGLYLFAGGLFLAMLLLALQQSTNIKAKD